MVFCHLKFIGVIRSSFPGILVIHVHDSMLNTRIQCCGSLKGVCSYVTNLLSCLSQNLIYVLIYFGKRRL